MKKNNDIVATQGVSADFSHLEDLATSLKIVNSFKHLDRIIGYKKPCSDAFFEELKRKVFFEVDIDPKRFRFRRW